MTQRETDVLNRHARAERLQLARKWRTFRREALLTQVHLAELCRISRRTVQMVESGEITPRVSTQRRFLTLVATFEHGGMETWLKWIQNKSPVRA